MNLYPLVVPASQPVTLTVEDLTPQVPYTVQIRSRRSSDLVYAGEQTADDRGSLCIEGTYAARGEHTLDVHPAPDGQRLVRLSFYVAPTDLSACCPLRCDFHIHTTYSDGHSTPAEMLIRGRELGLDVAVITDHNHYGASIEAVAERERLDLNLITMPGEEVSAPNWHIVSIHADVAIFRLALETYGLERADEVTRESILSRYEVLRWAVGAVQAHGGRAYLAHPYWSVPRGFHLPTDMYDRILEEGILDGVELLGDVDHEDNLRSLARYLDYRAAGRDIPVVSNSDTHWAVHTYGQYWTLVYAKEVSPEGVLDAIAEGRSVACMRVGDKLDAYGPFEYVDYAYFLEERFYPLHDALCVREAALAYRAWRGEQLPAGAMAARMAEMEALHALCWGH